MDKASTMTAEIKQVPNEAGKPPLTALVIQDGTKYATRITLSVKQRAQLAGQLLASLPRVGSGAGGSVAIADQVDSGITEAREMVSAFLRYQKQAEDEKAHIPAMARAKALGAKDKEQARRIVNRALDRPDDDRSTLSAQEWRNAVGYLQNSTRAHFFDITDPEQEKYAQEADDALTVDGESENMG